VSGFGVFVAGYRPQQTPQIHLFDILAAEFSDLEKSLLAAPGYSKKMEYQVS